MIHPWLLLLLPMVIFVASAMMMALGQMLQRADDHWWVVPLFLATLIPVVLMAFSTSLGILFFALVPVDLS